MRVLRVKHVVYLCLVEYSIESLITTIIPLEEEVNRQGMPDQNFENQGFLIENQDFIRIFFFKNRKKIRSFFLKFRKYLSVC